MIVNPDIELENLLAKGAAPATQHLEALLGELGIEARREGGELVLPGDLEALDPRKIVAGYGAGFKPEEIELEIFRTIGSTNDHVMSQLARRGTHARVALAEMQSAGKGRRGRAWVSPFGRNIYLTVGRFLKLPAGGLDGLSLVVGMQAVDALRGEGIQGVGLKWPNDILLDGGKLAGILVELKPAEQRGIGVVAGIGVNLSLDPRDAAKIDQAWSAVGPKAAIGRNRLAGRLIRNLVAAMERFDREGFAPFAGDWGKFNLYQGRKVRVVRGDATIEGVDRGVNGAGHLLLENEQGLVAYNSGEVSLRLAE